MVLVSRDFSGLSPVVSCLDLLAICKYTSECEFIFENARKKTSDGSDARQLRSPTGCTRTLPVRPPAPRRLWLAHHPRPAAPVRPSTAATNRAVAPRGAAAHSGATAWPWSAQEEGEAEEFDGAHVAIIVFQMFLKNIAIIVFQMF